MLAETPVITSHTIPNSVPDSSPTMNQSSEPYDAHFLPAVGRVDVLGSRQEEAQVIALAPEERARLLYPLRAAFEAEPVEDGMDHPAEEIIREALHCTEDQRGVLEWLRTFSLDAERPNFAASVLRCLGRQARPGTDSWRTALVRSALIMDDAEIRDAAVQAAESWGGQDMRNVLEAHNEPLDWLRNYVRDVIEDLGE